MRIATIPIRFSHSLPMVPSRFSEEYDAAWVKFGAATLGLAGIRGRGGGGGCNGKARRSVSSRDTLIGGCSGDLMVGGWGMGSAVGIPEVIWGSILADCSSR
jgi:hypothetical protein